MHKFIKHNIVWLLVSWLAGIGLGYAAFRASRAVYFSLMRSAASGSVSIVGLILLVVFPFLISAYAVYKSKTLLVYVVCFLKATLYSLNVFSVYCAFGSSGWLAVCLLLFSSSLTAVFLMYLWISYLTKQNDRCRTILICCLTASLVAVLVDFTFILPLAKSVLIF